MSILGLITTTTIDIFSSEFYGKNRNKELYWTVFFLALAAGSLIAYLLFKRKKIASLIIAAYTGEIFGTALANGLYFVWMNIPFYWIIIIIFTLGVPGITFFGIDKHMIWVTATFGAFVFMRCMALLLSHFPVIQNLPNLVETGAVTTTLPNYYWYMGFWFCVSCLGIATQLIFLKCMQMSP